MYSEDAAEEIRDGQQSKFWEYANDWLTRQMDSRLKTILKDTTTSDQLHFHRGFLAALQKVRKLPDALIDEVKIIRERTGGA